MNSAELLSHQTQQYRRGYRDGQTDQHPRRAARRDLDAEPPAYRSGYDDGWRAGHAALTLVTAALRLLTTCDHGEERPGACSHCEPLPPLVYVALNAAPLLCSNLDSDDPVLLRDALVLVEIVTADHDRRDLSQFAAELRHAQRLPSPAAPQHAEQQGLGRG
jgi:hypothetical protein